MSNSQQLNFYINDCPIGLFTADVYPSAIGWHTYEPYRGDGHAILAATLNDAETLTAWFPDGDTKCYFVIDSESFDVKRINGKWQIHILRFETAKRCTE